MAKTSLNIATLTKDQKLRLYDVIQEKKRRLREKGAIYVPNTGQSLVHNSTAKLRCVFSGNGAGKTALAANEVIWWIKGYNPELKTFTKVPSRVIILLDSPDKVADVWLPELQKWTTIKPEMLHKRGKPYYCQINFENGSEILFMFHQQEAMIFESIELDYLVADEPPPRHVYIALRRGARKKNRDPRFLLVGTPISGGWMRKEISDPWMKGELPDTECFVFGTAVNEANLSDGYIKEMEQILTEKEKRIRLHGEFYDLEGLALAHLFDRSTHTMDPFPWPEDWPVVVAIDPHPVKAHHAVMLGVDKDGQLYYIKELKEKLVAREFARVLKEWYRGYRVIDLSSDSLGSQEGTGGEGFKSFIQVLREEGVLARPTTWDDKSDEDFIERIRDVLLVPAEPNNFGEQHPKLRIFRSNLGIINDVENVAWVKIRNGDEYKPKLDISNKDFLSCLKYALACNLTFNKHKARAYHRINTAETYGIDSRAPQSKKIFRMRLNSINRKNPRIDDDDDEDDF